MNCHVQTQITQHHILICVPGSVVGIATGYGLDYPGQGQRVDSVNMGIKF